MSEGIKTVALRLPVAVVEAIDDMAETEEMFRSDVLRTLIVTHPRFTAQSEGTAA